MKLELTEDKEKEIKEFKIENIYKSIIQESIEKECFTKWIDEVKNIF